MSYYIRLRKTKAVILTVETKEEQTKAYDLAMEMHFGMGGKHENIPVEMHEDDTINIIDKLPSTSHTIEVVESLKQPPSLDWDEEMTDYRQSLKDAVQ